MSLDSPYRCMYLAPKIHATSLYGLGTGILYSGNTTRKIIQIINNFKIQILQVVFWETTGEKRMKYHPTCM